MTLDNGYQSGENLEALQQNQIEAYIPMVSGEKNHKEPLFDRIGN